MNRRRAALFALALTTVALAACASDVDRSASSTSEQKERPSPPARDWASSPAVVEIDGTPELFAFSDPHGGYEAMVHLLVANGLVAAETNDPQKLEWSGGAAVLVVAGDLIDKGTRSIDVIDALRTLERGASRARGRVIVTMGNHEAEFLADPENEKAERREDNAMGVVWDLRERDIDPKALVRGTDPEGRGRWLSSLPFGARVGSWFFSHSGNAGKRSIPELSKDLEQAIDRDGYDDDEILGKNSIVEAEEWFDDPKDDRAGREVADALGVKHIAFGHDPGAFDQRGRILSSKNGVLVKLNVNMGLGVEGATKGGLLLHVDLAKDVADVRDDSGTSAPLASE